MFLVTGYPLDTNVDRYVPQGVSHSAHPHYWDRSGVASELLYLTDCQSMLPNVLWCYSIGSGSTIYQNKFPAHIDVSVPNILRPKPAGAGIFIPVGRG